jgi:hypothetical protein
MAVFTTIPTERYQPHRSSLPTKLAVTILALMVRAANVLRRTDVAQSCQEGTYNHSRVPLASKKVAARMCVFPSNVAAAMSREKGRHTMRPSVTR